MRKNKLLLLLALLMTAATGAWATNYTTLAVGDVIKVGDTFSPTADGAFYNDFGVESGKTYTLMRADIDNDYNVTEKTDGAYYVFKYVSIMSPYIHFEKDFAVTAISDGLVVTKIEDVKGMQKYTLALHESGAPSGYTVSLKDGVKDAGKWTVKVGEGQAQALPIGGLKGDGSETVTLQYNGRLKVKGVKATSDAVPAGATPALSITSPSVGQVIGSDGKNYDYGSLPTGVTAVAKICYVSGSNGLALALTDEEGTMEWRPAIETIAAHTAPFTGGTWKVASKDEWSNMITAAGSYSALRDGFSSVGGTNMQSGYYWTSTEWDSNGAWSYNFSDGYWASDPMDFESYVRACLAFTVEQSAKEPATVTTAPTGAAIVGVGKTTALVSGGVADGGTLMYAVTTTNTKPTSTAGFSATVPTAQSVTASGKVYVWYFVKGDDTHADSEIAATAIEVPVADIVWDVTNVSDLRVTYKSYTKEGVTLSANGEMNGARWRNKGEENGIYFEALETGGYTFTAPTGKAFTKIEMKAQDSIGWDIANLGTGWAINNTTITWTGSAASTVGLLTGADDFNGKPVNSIEFYLVNAE